MRVRLFLRQNLFTLPGEAAHLPANAAILGGELSEQGAGGVTLRVEVWLDEKGRTLSGSPRTLFVPSAKIDHVWFED